MSSCFGIIRSKLEKPSRKHVETNIKQTNKLERADMSGNPPTITHRAGNFMVLGNVAESLTTNEEYADFDRVGGIFRFLLQYVRMETFKNYQYIIQFYSPAV